MNTDELSKYIDQLRRTDLLTLELAELLQILDVLLENGEPLTWKGMNPPATDKEIAYLQETFGTDSPLPKDLVTWFQWHNGQAPGAHRYLTTGDNYQRMLSIGDIANILEKHSHSMEQSPEWCPLFSLDSGEFDFISGIFLGGDQQGQINYFDGHTEKTQFFGLRSLAVFLVNKFMDIVDYPEPGQYWVHGVAAPLYETNHYHHALPGGVWHGASAQCASTIFHLYWSITSPEKLRSTLEWLEQTGHRSESETPEQYLAWDLCRASALAGLGGVRGWLSPEERWDIQLRLAKTIQDSFHSWKEVGESYGAGLEAFMGIEDHDFLVRLHENTKSPFHLPWDTELSAKPVVPHTDRVSIKAGDHKTFNFMLSNRTSPRILKMELAPGLYTLDNPPQRAFHLIGSSAGDTTVQGLQSKYATFQIEGLSVVIENIQVLHTPDIANEPGTQPALRVIGGSLKLINTQVHSPNTGISVIAASFLECTDSTITAKGTDGIYIRNSAGVVNNTTIHSGTKAATVVTVQQDQMSRFHTFDSELNGEEIGVLVQNGFWTSINCNITGENDSAVFVNNSGHLFIAEGSLKSHHATAIDTTYKEDELPASRNGAGDISISVTKTKFLPSNRSVVSRLGTRINLDSCFIYNGVFACGGAIYLTECTCLQKTMAENYGYLFLDSCEVKNEGEFSAVATSKGVFRAINSFFNAGAYITQDGLMRISHSKINGTGTLNAIFLSDFGELWLENCAVNLEQGKHSLMTTNGGRLSALNTSFTSKATYTASYYNNAARFWNCRFSNDCDDGMALVGQGMSIFRKCVVQAKNTALWTNFGKNHFYYSLLQSQNIGLQLAANVEILLCHCDLKAPQAALGDDSYQIYSEKSNIHGECEPIIEAYNSDWQSFGGITKNANGETIVDINFIDGSVWQILDRLEGHRGQTARLLVFMTARCILPESDLHISLEETHIRIVSEEDLPEEFLATLADVCTDGEETEFVVGMYAEDEYQGEFEPIFFSPFGIKELQNRWNPDEEDTTHNDNDSEASDETEDTELDESY